MANDDEERFLAIYGETRARIVAYVMRRVASREDAADVVAETYAIAWRRLEDVPSGHAALLWLYVTARHQLQNRGRRLHRQEELLERLVAALDSVELAEEPQDEEGLLALFSLTSLPDDQREVLMLAGWEGLSAAEIGRVLDCSPTAARIRLHRARLHLKAELAGTSAVPKHRPVRQHEPDEGAAIACVPEEA